jgi:phage/plasmid-like protein (TIGR03299 family)
MSHELDFTNNRANMAFTGSRSKIWHGLGQELEVGAGIDTWIKEAGMDWEVFESAITYQSYDIANGIQAHAFPDKKALFRSDNHAPLSIVGDTYKIVQPAQVLEFFRDLVENHNMQLSTAGVLFGGKRFWAMADLDKEAQNVDGDKILGRLLLTTSVDGTLATTAQFVSERVVCNNTLRIALNENSTNLVRVTHKSDWDANQVKIDLGLIDASWDKFITDMRKLAEVKVEDSFARKYFQDKFYNPKIDATEQTWGAVKKVDDLMKLFKNGNGSELSGNTAWGVVNAVTDLYTHGTGRKQDPSKKFWNAFMDSDKIKQTVVNDMLELV